jgi:hypothetical protein
MKYAFIIIIALILSGCATAMGRGMDSRAENWYKPGTSEAQTASDIEACRERSGYNHKFIFTEQAIHSYNSYMDGCMSKAGYDWYRDDRNPRSGAPVQSGSPAGSTGSTSVRTLGK